MMILAAVIASGQVLPSIDRNWLNQQVRIEAAAFEKPMRPLNPTLPTTPNTYRKLSSYANTTGM